MTKQDLKNFLKIASMEVKDGMPQEKCEIFTFTGFLFREEPMQGGVIHDFTPAMGKLSDEFMEKIKPLSAEILRLVTIELMEKMIDDVDSGRFDIKTQEFK